ncbi:MAG: hypothetical protein PHF76_11900 [Bacteroidales bacterium]|jgi:hypothetical protein|nr:hypothetical protein [Bacteroidales bacterium]MDD2642756.1 hypothetical protein [Bacteroidales bacterium]MDD3915334.1 hypothetical protein [Bacteroidales bacterium]MDD4500428.1 hypothetical protein [Bacteroidales bacterium]
MNVIKMSFVSKSGKTIIVETKGDDSDNSDSAAKCRLGNKWAKLAGKDFTFSGRYPFSDSGDTRSLWV